jgi:hypothetical protein
LPEQFELAGVERRRGTAAIEGLDAPKRSEQWLDLIRPAAVQAETLVALGEPAAFGGFLLGDKDIALLRMVELGLVSGPGWEPCRDQRQVLAEVASGLCFGHPP